jgi:hypothetical protein
MLPVVEAFVKAIDLMDDLRREKYTADYALLGGLALSAWVRPRTTRDVDLAVMLAPDKTWEDVADFLTSRLRKRIVVQRGSVRTNIKEKISFRFGQIEVDLIGTSGFPLAEEALRAAPTARVFSKRVKVVTPEYLILLKLLPLSPQDALDIRELDQAADRRKLRALARKHFLSDRLAEVLAGRKPGKPFSRV